MLSKYFVSYLIFKTIFRKGLLLRKLNKNQINGFLWLNLLSHQILFFERQLFNLLILQYNWEYILKILRDYNCFVIQYLTLLYHKYQHASRELIKAQYTSTNPHALINQVYAKQVIYKRKDIIRKSNVVKYINPDLYFLYSLCLFQLNKFQQSEHFFQMAISINPLSDMYDFNKVQIRNKLDILENSIRNSLISELDCRMLLKYAQNLRHEKNFFKTLQIYQKIFKTIPQNQNYLYLQNYANILYDLGRYSEAIQIYQFNISKNPTRMLLYNNCSVLYTVIENYQKAEQYIKIAIEGAPHRPDFVYNYSIILAKTKRYQESINKILQAISADQNDPIFKLKYALILLQQSDSINNSIKGQEKEIIQYNLAFPFQIFRKCVQVNSNKQVNSYYRMYTIKNIKMFFKLTLMIHQYCYENLKWKQIKNMINVITDYLIVGELKKLKKIQELLSIIDKSLQQLIKNKFVQTFIKRSQKQMNTSTQQIQQQQNSFAQIVLSQQQIKDSQSLELWEFLQKWKKQISKIFQKQTQKFSISYSNEKRENKQQILQ